MFDDMMLSMGKIPYEGADTAGNVLPANVDPVLRWFM
jgi:hypothetical protein